MCLSVEFLFEVCNVGVVYGCYILVVFFVKEDYENGSLEIIYG